MITSEKVLEERIPSLFLCQLSCPQLFFRQIVNHTWEGDIFVWDDSCELGTYHCHAVMFVMGYVYVCQSLYFMYGSRPQQTIGMCWHYHLTMCTPMAVQQVKALTCCIHITRMQRIVTYDQNRLYQIFVMFIGLYLSLLVINNLITIYFRFHSSSNVILTSRWMKTTRF